MYEISNQTIMSKTVLITGGSRGIGRATAEKFLTKGYTVIATSTSGEFSFSHENMITHTYDQSDAGSIAKFVSWIKEHEHKIDILINNAGILLDWTIDCVDIEILKKTMSVNVYGLIDLTEQLLNHISKDGLIINISSGLGALNASMGTMAPAYSITKAGVNMYTKKLHAKIASEGKTAISYEPGWVKTDMGGTDAPRTPDEPANDLFTLASQDPKPAGGLFYNTNGVRDW